MIEIRDDRGNILHGVEATSLEKAFLGNTYLRCAQLRGANLRGANLRDADLREADLSGADLRGATLENADFRSAKLEGVDLRGAELKGVNFENASLVRANLEDQNLCGTKLVGAILIEARLARVSAIRVDLTFAHLRSADIEDAVFNNCHFGATDLRGLDLTKAKVFTGSGKGSESFVWAGSGSLFNSSTKWPSLTAYLAFLGVRRLLIAGFFSGLMFAGMAGIIMYLFGTRSGMAQLTAFVLGGLLGMVVSALSPFLRPDAA